MSSILQERFTSVSDLGNNPLDCPPPLKCSQLEFCSSDRCGKVQTSSLCPLFAPSPENGWGSFRQQENPLSGGGRSERPRDMTPCFYMKADV
ncbi:hypothetical protein P8C59_000076 [Phyllachora maydis]|uniref:Uncharacterized protein n=1 Tax=Phyllachora maydis TaxID=1825666 RepID=A0AAD9MAS4_9PEZI|nr:hypothetical protein P8C59_000076 [Phyllachora maydis]